MTSRLFDELERTLRGTPARSLGALPPDVRAASVLVPFFVQDGEPHLLFIKRPDGNYRHAGQIAFPGGKRDACDKDALACALREANEEVGIAPRDVRLLGFLDEYDTVVTGFRVSPVVGVIPWPYPLALSPREIERTLEVPVRTLLDPSRFRVEDRETRFGPRKVYYFDVGRDVIWGVTAAILRPLLDMIRALPSAQALDLSSTL